MPATQNKTIKAAAGDYTTMALAEAGEQVIAADLVAGDILRQFECFNVADPGACTIDGCTTDATRYIRAYATAGGEAIMPFSTSRYRMAAAGNLLTVADLYCRIERLQFEQQSSIGTRLTVRLDAGGQGSQVTGCLARNTGTSASDMFDAQTQTTTINLSGFINDVAIGNATNGGGFVSAANGSAIVKRYNCTAVACATNFSNTSGVVTEINCLGAAPVTTDFSGTTTRTFCASQDATADDNGGAGNRISQTFTFVSAGTGDYHLTIGDAGARDVGTDLSADASFPFSTDFDGVPRGALWDIGATEAAGVAANITTTSPYVQPVPMRPQPGGFQQSGGVLSLRFATSAPPSPPSSATVATNGPAAYIQPIPMRAGPPFGFPLAMPFAFAASPPQAQGASFAAPDGVGYLMKIPMRQGPGGFARGQAAIGGMNGSTSNPIPVTPSTAGTGSRIGRMLRTGKL